MKRRVRADGAAFQQPYSEAALHLSLRQCCVHSVFARIVPDIRHKPRYSTFHFTSGTKSDTKLKVYLVLLRGRHASFSQFPFGTNDHTTIALVIPCKVYFKFSDLSAFLCSVLHESLFGCSAPFKLNHGQYEAVECAQHSNICVVCLSFVCGAEYRCTKRRLG